MSKETLFNRIDPVLYAMTREELQCSRYILSAFLDYVEQEGEAITPATIKSVIRNIIGNIYLLDYYYDSRATTQDQ